MRRCRALMLVVSILAVACQPAATAPAGATGSAPAGSRAALNATPTPLPSKPVALPRPSDLPTDGTCEEGMTCLGLLTPGTTYLTKDFQPTFTFEVPSSGWENLGDEGGAFVMESLTAPGDSIAFFRDPRPGTPSSPGTGRSASELADWLATNRSLEVTDAREVKVGGLAGVTLDLRIAPGATSSSPCDVQVCVPLFFGRSPNGDPDYWQWDWSSAGREAQRAYLLEGPDGVIAIFVDSLDGITFDAMTSAWDQVAPTVRFR